MAWQAFRPFLQIIWQELRKVDSGRKLHGAALTFKNPALRSSYNMLYI
jgi:hypothetical protein